MKERERRANYVGCHGGQTHRRRAMAWRKALAESGSLNCWGGEPKVLRKARLEMEWMKAKKKICLF